MTRAVKTVKRRNRRQPIVKPPVTSSEYMERAEKLFREKWGHEFKPDQRKAVQSILEGRDTLLVASTGFGKTVVFQLPAIVVPGTTIVVSPLIALMQDQVYECNQRGIRATFVNSTLTGKEQAERLHRLVRGEYDLFYVAPERIRSIQFQQALEAAKINFVAIDEAHCISHYSEDFRPSYLTIPDVLHEINCRPPIIGVTATATRMMAKWTAEALGFREGSTEIISDPIRTNFTYETLACNSSSQAWGWLQRLAYSLTSSGGRRIIYVPTRKGTEKVADMLQEETGTGAESIGIYHAGMRTKDRESIQDDFKEGRTPIICATNAFGMGINVPDIRAVIHLGVPDSLESYQQESGRAGRDGLPATAMLIHDPKAASLRSFFLNQKNPPYERYVMVWEWLHRNLQEGQARTVRNSDICDFLMDEYDEEVNVYEVEAVLLTMEAYSLIRRGYRLGNAVYRTTMAVMEKALNESTNDSVSIVLREIISQLGGVAEGDFILSIRKLSLQTGLPCGLIREVVSDLEDAGQIEMERQLSTKSVGIIPYGKPIEEVLPESRIDDKRKRDEHRLQQVMRYAGLRTSDERVDFIRQYFMGDA